MEIFVKSFAKMYFLMIPQPSGGPTAAQTDFRQGLKKGLKKKLMVSIVYPALWSDSRRWAAGVGAKDGLADGILAFWIFAR